MQQNIWLFTSGSYDGSIHCLPIMANNKEQVISYFRNHLEDFLFMFENLYCCTTNYGIIREKLDQWYKKCDFFKCLNNEKNKKKFLNDIRKVIDSLTDQEIIDEFWAYQKDSEGSFVIINEILGEKIVILS